MVPRQRQQRDEDAKADYGQVAVQQPGQNLERLEGPRPAVQPSRLGKNQVGAAAAVHGRCASQSGIAAAHLGWSRGHFTSGATTFVEEMTDANELGQQKLNTAIPEGDHGNLGSSNLRVYTIEAKQVKAGRLSHHLLRQHW